jgi:hypothetical protein
MATNLRFHNAPTDTRSSAQGEPESRVVIPFPSALAAARDRLVAAKVQGQVFANQPETALREGVLASPFRHAPDVQSSDELIRDIESTLDRMQHRLDRFKRQVDECFKFPAPPDDFGLRDGSNAESDIDVIRAVAGQGLPAPKC